MTWCEIIRRSIQFTLSILMCIQLNLAFQVMEFRVTHLTKRPKPDGISEKKAIRQYELKIKARHSVSQFFDGLFILQRPCHAQVVIYINYSDFYQPRMMKHCFVIPNGDMSDDSNVCAAAQHHST